MQVEQAENARATGLVGEDDVRVAARIEQLVETERWTRHQEDALRPTADQERLQDLASDRPERDLIWHGARVRRRSVPGCHPDTAFAVALVAEGWVVAVWVGDGGVKTVGVLEEVGVGAGMGAVVPGGVGAGPQATAHGRISASRRSSFRGPVFTMRSRARSSCHLPLPVWLCDEDQLDFAVHLPRVEVVLAAASKADHDGAKERPGWRRNGTCSSSVRARLGGGC